jgi:hypothetical protein
MPQSFDPSILGRTAADLAAMTPEELEDARREDVNRALDLVRAIERAYYARRGDPCLTAAREALKDLARG